MWIITCTSCEMKVSQCSVVFKVGGRCGQWKAEEVKHDEHWVGKVQLLIAV